MADQAATATADEGADPQITCIIKSSSDQKFTITVSSTSTVGDLKQTLSASEYANIPSERQRLIYSGRVLKDADTLGACKIKDGNTIHLVKGAESNSRQTPAAQNTSGAAAASGNTSNVPANIASGPGANNPLAHLTGARYAGMHGLPSMDMFGADGGMGAPPNSDQMLRMLEDPNTAQMMNEAMNNPAVIDMMRNNPMIRDNPMIRAAIDNPEMRRMLLNPQMLRMQMQMERAMGNSGAGAGSFPMPGQTDTTPSGEAPTGTQGAPVATPNAQNPPAGAGPNPFAALFPGGVPAVPSTGAAAQPQNPLGNMFGANQTGQQDPFQQAALQMMQNPEAMRQMMQMMGGGAAAGGVGGGSGGEAGFNPFAGGMGLPQPQAPADNRPPEERYADQLRQLNDMGFFEFDRNIQALRRSGGNVQGAIEFLLG